MKIEQFEYSSKDMERSDVVRLINCKNCKVERINKQITIFILIFLRIYRCESEVSKKGGIKHLFKIINVGCVAFDYFHYFTGNCHSLQLQMKLLFEHSV